ncbi:MAG: HIT family protein [Planctomycetes bacterium]|nr:HIT family protein [Planctomycetota bacterium]
MSTCVFCEISAGRIPCTKLYENEHVLAFLDIGPISDGHTLVVPKAHYDRLHQCPPDVLAELGRVVGFLAEPVARAVQADGYNVLNNNGSAAGQVVEHVHVHIIPRKTGDGVFDRWPAYKYPPGKAEAIAEKIKKNLAR